MIPATQLSGRKSFFPAPSTWRDFKAAKWCDMNKAVLTNDWNQSLISDKEKEPQGVELSPIENHASDRANNVSASH